MKCVFQLEQQQQKKNKNKTEQQQQKTRICMSVFFEFFIVTKLMQSTSWGFPCDLYRLVCKPKVVLKGCGFV